MTDNDFNPVVEIQAEVQVTPTLELQAEVDMGSLASERNAEAWAVGQRGGVDVSSTDQTYHNNAKYWAEQAEQTVVGSIIDDTSTALNKTWSAHKVSEEFAETNGEVTDLKSAIAEGTLVAGTAAQVLGRFNDDRVPYVFRKTGGDVSAYYREIDKLIGGTVAWNQLIQNGNFANSDNWTAAGTGTTMSVANNKMTVTNGTASYSGIMNTRTNIKPIEGHKYLFVATLKSDTDMSNSCDFAIHAGPQQASSVFSLTANKEETISKIINVNATLAAGTNTVQFQLFIPHEDAVENATVEVKNFNVFDLTQMFGSTIADYINTLETGTAGAGVAWFRSLFPNDYYAYDAGSLQSVNAASHRMTGFNQCDEDFVSGEININTGINNNSSTRCRSKNFLPIIPNKTYYCKSGFDCYAFFYDENKNYLGFHGASLANKTFTPAVLSNTKNNGSTFANAMYVRFRYDNATYEHDFCMNFSNTSRNGEYEPYQLYSYPLGNVELRGIPKLDANNKLYYDGDEYASDGTVTRKYGIVDLGTLTWTKDSSYTYTRFAAEGQITDKWQPNGTADRADGLLCQNYEANYAAVSGTVDKYISGYKNTTSIYITDSSYTDAETFKTAMSGVYLVYEIATPTAASSDPFAEVQTCNKYGTEEYVDRGVTASTPTRDVSIPVGHDTQYAVDVFDYIDEKIAELGS